MSDFARLIEEARGKLPLRTLMTQFGRAPKGDRWNSFDCPYCNNKGCAGVFTHDGMEFFKCHHTDCPTGTKGLEQIAFIAHEQRLSSRDAAVEFLKMAGLWKDHESHAPSVMPGKAARKRKPPQGYDSDQPPLPAAEPGKPQEGSGPDSTPNPQSLSPVEAEREEKAGADAADAAGGQEELLIAQAVEVLRAEGKASVSLLQRRLSVGYTKACRIMDELERRGCVGPARGVEPREILKLPIAGEAAVGRAGETPAPLPIPPEAPEALGEEDELTEGVKALRKFFGQLKLTEAHREELWAKRGATPQTCEEAGFKSSCRENKDLLLALVPEFQMTDLLDIGLWVQGENAGDQPRPNAKYYGWGIAGKKKGEDGKEEIVYDWTFPVLIPYFDVRGEIVHLRPHKDMQKGKPTRLFLARSRAGSPAQPPPQFAAITEGEFKAWAVRQALGGAVAMAALPGITNAKPMHSEIVDWLDETFKGLARSPQVVVCYDNEEKADPKLASFKREEWKRYEAEVWARLLAKRLAAEGFDARVAHLPVEWRDEKGKADWDGALRKLITETSNIEHRTSNIEQIWAGCEVKVREAFQQVMRSGLRPEHVWRSGLFDEKAEKTIFARIEKLGYVPALPRGGEEEQDVARRLMRMVKRLRKTGKLTKKQIGFVYGLAKKYRDLSGGYYTLKPLRDVTQEQWQDERGKAGDRDDVELRRVCDVVLRGIPERISDFTMEASFCLVLLNGKRQRLVSIHNKHGVRSEALLLPSLPFSQPSKFREWLLDNISGATWRAGERELQDLQADMARELAHKDVFEVGVRGHHAESDMWFFGDCAYTPDGKEIKANAQGVFWQGGKGYKPSEFDHEGQQFSQGMPNLRPDVKASDLEVQDLFIEVAQRLHETLGSSEGWLLLGEIYACGAGPEIFKRFTALPGVWIHGETSQGKSSVARWLLKLWGFAREQGMPLPDSTKVGVSIALQQYGNLPVWLEEYQPDAPKWMIEKLKNAFGRESGLKKTFDGEESRVVRAQAMVTGVATAADAQLRSRYAHAQVAAKKRKVNHYDWFEANSEKFFLLARHIMRHRAEFARQVNKALDEWLRHEIPDARALRVYGTAFAGFTALSRMLGAFNEGAIEAFKEKLLASCHEQSSQVRNAIYVNQFWVDVLSCVQSGFMQQMKVDLHEVFHVRELSGDDKFKLSAYQLELGDQTPKMRFPSYRLYFKAALLLDVVRRYKRTQGQDLPLTPEDFRSQMRMRPYWVEPPKHTGIHRQRFDNDKGLQTCWAIDLNWHEQGYREVADEDFKASLYREGQMEAGIFLPVDEWVDPRRGDLFALVERLLKPAVAT